MGGRILKVPPSVALSWPKPNYVNPETRGWGSPVLLIILFVLYFAVYIARMWARLMIARNAGLDDLFASIAMVFVVGLTVAVLLGILKYGFQWHVWDGLVTEKAQDIARHSALSIEVLYLVSGSLIKISILCFYRRLMNSSVDILFRNCVWACMVFVAVPGVIYTFLVLFVVDEASVIVSSCIIGSVQDLLICYLPIRLVWNLNIPKLQKVALIGIFGLGLLTCICGLVRCSYAIYVYYGTYDFTWYSYYGWVWTAVEVDLGLICASAPALKVFFRRYFVQPTNSPDQSDEIGYYGPSNLISDPQSKSSERDIVVVENIEIRSHRRSTIEDGCESGMIR